MRTPGRSTSASVRIGEPAGTRQVTGISRYAAVNAISLARCGSAPRKPTSQAPFLAPSARSPAWRYSTNSTGTPRRRASSRPRSGATPTGTPSRVPETMRKLPWLTPTRSLPLGASSARTAAGTELMPGILAAADLAVSGEIFRVAATFQRLRRRVGAAGIALALEGIGHQRPASRALRPGSRLLRRLRGLRRRHADARLARARAGVLARAADLHAISAGLRVGVLDDLGSPVAEPVLEALRLAAVAGLQDRVAAQVERRRAVDRDRDLHFARRAARGLHGKVLDIRNRVRRQRQEWRGYQEDGKGLPFHVRIIDRRSGYSGIARRVSKRRLSQITTRSSYCGSSERTMRST